MSKPEIIAEVGASTGRRLFGVMMIGLLGLLLLYVALVNSPTNPGWKLFLLVVGAGAIWAAHRMRRATAITIELTRDQLRCNDGTIITRVADIHGIDRGLFAFKPSNGFVLKLKHTAPATWRPGMWWRFANRVGVGGVTPGSQTKAMADIIAAMLAERG